MRKNAGAGFAAIVLLGAGGFAAPGRAMAQGSIGVQPTVGTIPDGIGLNATAAVSADRRYVRLSLGFNSSTVQGFQNIPFPVGAVGMGGGEPRGSARRCRRRIAERPDRDERAGRAGRDGGVGPRR